MDQDKELLEGQQLEELYRMIDRTDDKNKLFRTTIKQMSDIFNMTPEALLGSLWLVFKKEISELPQDRIKYILDDVKQQIDKMEKEEFDMVLYQDK